MRYLSTRGGAASSTPRPRFCDILLGGLAPDGGLYLPEEYPTVTPGELAEWRHLSYAELAFRILSKFIDDIPPADLKAICDKTYTAHTYRFTREGSDAREITPITWLNGAQEGKLGLLELSNGPTLAFKDMAMQLLGNLFEYVLKQRGETINILGATSGDTGSAAEYAMRGKTGVRVFMLSPDGKMSAFQRAQMYSLQDPNIFNLAVRGMFDDAQDIVKAVSNDHAFKAKYKIGAVNSINWGRVAAQIVYYFKGYFAATADNNETVDFCVPSGNFGNICAGHIARLMGLPIRRLVLATNENDVLDEFFRTGIYRPRAASETHVTSSPSMDISKASNFERFIFDLVGRDGSLVRELWSHVESRGGAFDLSRTPHFEALPRFGFASGSSTHGDRLKTIRDVYEKHGLMIDTHTADGVKVARDKLAEWRGMDDREVPMLVLETAQAVKFDATIREALNRDPVRPAELDGIEKLLQRVTVIDPDVGQVKAFIEQHC
jgi:threonine synthase